MSRNRIFLLTGLLVALLLAGVVSSFASSSPDGLSAAARKGCTFDARGDITGGDCLARRETKNQTDDSPLAGYGIRGLGDGPLSTGLAGVIGVLLTFGVGYGVFRLVRRPTRSEPTNVG
jgi:cobalt/nickel transport protein